MKDYALEKLDSNLMELLIKYDVKFTSNEKKCIIHKKSRTVTKGRISSYIPILNIMLKNQRRNDDAKMDHQPSQSQIDPPSALTAQPSWSVLTPNSPIAQTKEEDILLVRRKP